MKIIITGTAPYDGEYDVQFDRLTNGQIRTIKRLSGYTPVEYVTAGERGDNDFLVAIAVVAVEGSKRHPIVDEKAFWNAEAGGITIDLEEAEESPPQTAPGTTSTLSGAPSPTDSANPASLLRATGTP